MVTIDPEIVKEVTVKQFDHFVDAIHIEAPPDELVLDLAQGIKIIFHFEMKIFVNLQGHCGMREKSSMFLSPVFKNLIFLCSWATVGQ